MITINSHLAGQVGILTSMVIIHAVGLAASCLAGLFLREQDPKKKTPLYYYLGGAAGLFLVWSNALTIPVLGASGTIVLGISGQMMMSLWADSTGFLGWKKQPFSRLRLAGVLMTLPGLVLMAENFRLQWGLCILALVTGMANLVIMMINAGLAARRGFVRGSAINFLAGLAATFAIILLMMLLPSSGPSIPDLGALPPLLLTGGIVGVGVITGINKVLPSLPVFQSTMLMFLGQVSVGTGLDYILTGSVSFRKALGIAVISLGVLLNNLESSRKIQRA